MSAGRSDGVDALTGRERETLRLLLAGHDAKSIARAQGLSVHTVNERLRDARRKLGASSSREAARLLAEAERGGPETLGDKELGVPDPAGGVRRETRPDAPHGAAHRLSWFGGGMLAMSLVIAAAALWPALHGNDPPGARGARVPAAPAATLGRPAPAATGAARDWLGLIDRGRWEESWRAAGSSFTARVTAAGWAASGRAAREAVGNPSARAVRIEVRTGTLPGLPPGDYQVVEFSTRFARKPDTIERLVLTREGGRWRVIGYFIQ